VKKAPLSYAASSFATKADWAVQEVTCEARFVPLLIGRRGWTIKHIQDTSGARVDIDQSVTPRRIKISGKKDCVASAVGMVKDVLSYPHAQLESSEDIPAFDEEADGTHSPPPSSLIMTGDIKSTVSASSSLSSTPEPSMASSGKGSSYKHPGPAGAMIPPNITPPIVQTSFGEFSLSREAPRTMESGTSDAAHLFSMTNDASRQAQDAHYATLPPHGGAYGQAPLYEQSHQDTSFGRGMPFGQHQQPANPASFGGASAFGQSQQSAPYGLQPQPIGQPPMLRDVLGSSGGMMQDPIGQAMPQSRPQYTADSYQPAHLLFPRSESKGGQMLSGNLNDVDALLPDLWAQGSRLSASEHNNMDHSPGYLLPAQRPPYRQHSDGEIPTHLYSESRLGRRNSMPSPIPVAHPPGLAAREDSDMVDSLFGPVAGEQNLLSGLRGLSLNNNALGWGSSIAGWGNENNNGEAQRSKHTNTLPAGLLDSGQQQQGQSRFDWG
jgi:hypothetical protein